MLRPGRYVHVKWSMHWWTGGHGMDNILPLCSKQRSRVSYGTKTDSKMEAYRGGCTDKTWSNVTACPQWCNDRKHDEYPAILACLSSRTFSKEDYRS